MFIFIRRHQTLFLSGSILIYSHQPCMNDSDLPFPHQHSVSSLFFISVGLFFIVVLICIFLNVDDVHFSCSCLSSECSSLVRCQFMYFACFFFLIFIYLFRALPGLSCGTWDIRSPLQHVVSLVAARKFLVAAYGI